MSTKLTGYVWDGCAASGMKLSSVAIMARLADFSNDEGVCWPSIETIARQIGAGMSTVRTAIARLEAEGWLTRNPVSVEVQSVTDGVKVKVSRVPDGVAEYSVWGLKLPTLRQRLFRCVSIRENDDGTYAITAVQHVPEKEAIVDNRHAASCGL